MNRLAALYFAFWAAFLDPSLGIGPVIALDYGSKKGMEMRRRNSSSTLAGKSFMKSMKDEYLIIGGGRL